MKSKYVAGILAIILGLVGMHKFYLNKISTGLIRFLLFFLFIYLGFSIGIKILFIISLIEGIKFFTMPDDKFNNEYNDEQSLFDKPRPWGGKQGRQMARPKDNPYKKTGIEKYKDYDYQGAIEDFNKALILEPEDNAIHFNLACAYSINEDSDKAFYHLNKAIDCGYNDMDKLKIHEALAYIRTLPEYDDWIKKTKSTETIKTQTKNDLPDLLEQVRQLNERREKGELDDEKFLKERKKLLG